MFELSISEDTTSFISNIENNNITPWLHQQFVPNIGMGGKRMDWRIILSWSTPNIN